MRRPENVQIRISIESVSCRILGYTFEKMNEIDQTKDQPYLAPEKKE